MNRQKHLYISELLLGHSEVVPQFVHECLADLMAYFCFAGTDRFDILLIEDDVGGTYRNIKDAFFRRWHAVKDA